jgi:hypothetical protein
MQRPEPFRLVPIREVTGLREGDRIVRMTEPAEVKFRSNNEVLKALANFASTVSLVTGQDDLFEPCLGVQIGRNFIPINALSSDEYFVVTGGGSRFSAWHVDDSQNVNVPFPATETHDGGSKFDSTPNQRHPANTGRPNPFAVAEAKLKETLDRHFAEWEREAKAKAEAEFQNEIRFAMRRFAYSVLERHRATVYADSYGFRLSIPQKPHLDAKYQLSQWIEQLDNAYILDEDVAEDAFEEQDPKIYRKNPLGKVRFGRQVLETYGVRALIERTREYLIQRNSENDRILIDRLTVLEQGMEDNSAIYIGITVEGVPTKGRKPITHRTIHFDFDIL